ncbi:MgtC/SapB family protein [Actinoplanes sp. CA-030573]|uniref:MgtC/SapB family protein n=1 Tax=Actinoplanes sp. CA-030573 TaxID=3239898 RepID=UPI003D9066F4
MSIPPYATPPAPELLTTTIWVPSRDRRRTAFLNSTFDRLSPYRSRPSHGPSAATEPQRNVRTLGSVVLASFGEPTGQGWTQIGELVLAFLLSAAIGLERDVRQKSAGLRTHTLVGFASALIMLVSKYGFTDVLGPHTVLDPSRIAAQIVSGIGFIGGGLIFVRRDAVRGLTTAAVIWLTAAVGMAAGAGLWLLAIVVTAGHFLVVFGFAPLAARLPRSRYAPSRIRLTYVDGRGVLRAVLAECARQNFVTSETAFEQVDGRPDPRTVAAGLTVQGRGSVSDLTAAIADIDGVLAVSGDDGNTPTP